ncbi:hypothetical protein QJS04_geneDACA000047 [Acorus gramineus]|uniref:Uncharacterized protein n=1 Tax=Acorus gramineus TaxID=55184 RepID=A0AAV9AT84_ACOGR|nr:hypothetical protein QJS04_geneDACA000047 [Acorus gramineus]
MTTSLGSKKRIHAMSLVRMTSSERVVALANVRRKVGLDWCGVSVFLKQIAWKLKSQWRNAVGSQKDRLRFGYDPQSYSQNFDDCSTCDHPYQY